jgi:vacuolar-type H+-ATPase subunit E/Vma4
MRALDAANQKISRLELDAERLARRVTEEKVKVLEFRESEERLLKELEAEREKVEYLSPFEARANLLEAQLVGLERLTGIRRGADESEALSQGWPASGQPGERVEGSSGPATEPPSTGR